VDTPVSLKTENVRDLTARALIFAAVKSERDSSRRNIAVIVRCPRAALLDIPFNKGGEMYVSSHLAALPSENLPVDIGHEI
jgi:hypothetical protein